LADASAHLWNGDTSYATARRSPGGDHPSDLARLMSPYPGEEKRDLQTSASATVSGTHATCTPFFDRTQPLSEQRASPKAIASEPRLRANRRNLMNQPREGRDH